MGEIADMVLDGMLCEGCGEVFEDIMIGNDSPGYPRKCITCEKGDPDNENRKT